jgi:hypothetical protein
MTDELDFSQFDPGEMGLEDWIEIQIRKRTTLLQRMMEPTLEVISLLKPRNKQ